MAVQKLEVLELVPEYFKNCLEFRLSVFVAYTSYLSLWVGMCLLPIQIKGAVDFELIEKSLPCTLKDVLSLR